MFDENIWKVNKKFEYPFHPTKKPGGTQKKTRNRNSNVLGADGDVERRKRRLKKKVKSTISVFLFCFLAVCGIYKNVTEVKATNFASKVVNIGGPITLEGNYTVTVWRSGNTVYCKAHVYVAAPNGAWSAMGAQVSANKGSASNTFVGNGSATPKAGSGDVQFSFTDAGAGTVSGTIYAGFMPNLNGSQALSATFSVSYPPSNIDSTVPSNNANGKITYVSHCQNVGWQSWVSDGATSGTTGKGLRMETIAIDSKLVGLSYQAHVANKGWMSLKTNGQAAGTVGEALAIQAIKISLTGDNAPYYTLKYRAHVASKGWMSWVNAGEIAGTTGQNLDIQAIEITLTPKSYTVTYNGNGGLYNGSSTWSNTATYNENYTTYSNDNFFTRDGYRFVGWNTKADGSGTDWTGWINKPWQWSYGHGVTLYAQWKANNYTVSINPNGGSYNGTTGITKISQALGTTVEINQIPTRSGYTFVGWTRSGSGSLHSGNSYGRSGITQYEKADADGTAYTNYKMNFNNTTNAGYAYPSIQYFSYGYTSGHTYRLSVDVRVNKSSGNEYAHIRHSAFVNNWVAPSTTVNYLTNGWEHRTVERTFTGTTSEQSGTKYNIYPFVEFYAGIAGGKTGILDFDMKNLTIYDVTAGKYINSNYENVKNGATVDVGKGDTTITAVWVPNSYQQTVRVRFENADGSFTDYSQAYQANHDYGSTFEWEFPASKQYESTKVSYKVTGAKSTDVTVYRKKYTVKILTKTQKLDGTWPDSYSDVSSRYVKSSYRYGEECRTQISLIGAPDTEHPYWEAFAVTENKELKYDLKRYKNTLKIYASLSDKIDEERENKYFTFDFYVADKLVRQSVYNVNDVSIYYGNNYTIKNIQPRNGYHYTNMYFSRNPIHNLGKPTKDENGVFNGYFSGESTYQYSLCISPNTYTINYNGNGATSGTTTSSSHTYNESKSLTKNGFTRTGYSFKGWATNADGSGTIYSNEQEVKNLSEKNNDNVTLYAQWKPNNYTYNIKYISSSGKELGTDTITGTFDTSKTVTPPAKTGYTTPAAQTVKFDSTSPKTITFTYPLIDYTISYDINGGTALSGQRTSYNIESSTYTLPVPSRTGYKFIGWTGSNGNTPQKSVTIATGSTGDKSYKANWKSNSLTIRYHSNGAFGGNKYENSSWKNDIVFDYGQSTDIVVYIQNLEEGSAANSGLQTYGVYDYSWKRKNDIYMYKNGYIGTGKYNTKPNGSGIEIDENKTFNSVIELANYLGTSIDSKDNSIDLYPQWKAISYSIVYNSNGATSGSMTEQAAIFDKNVELAPNSFSRKYTVTYNAMGGTVNAPNNVATATFNGWEDRGSISFMDKNYSYNEFDAPYYSQGYTDLNAAFGFNKYNLIKHYFLYGKSEGRNPKDKTGKAGLYPNKATVKNMTITNGYKVNLYANWKLGSVTLPTPTRFGYKFLGWYTATEGGTKTTGATYTPTSNVTLYAHWKLDSYYIDYNVNDAGLTDRITDNLPDNNGSLPGKDTAVMLTDFALQNGSKYNTKYTFKEWNTKPDGSGKKFTTSITNDGSLCKPGETLTLYAIWDTAPTITGKNFYMLENMKPASDILTSGKGLDKNPIDHFPDNMKDVVYPVKGYTKNGTDISSRIKVDYVEFDNSKTATASIDTKKPGKYTVHYSLTDGKQTKKFTRTITVLSASTPVINAGDRYFNKGSFVTAEMLLSTVTSGDRYDGDLTTKVAVLNMEHVAFNTVGSYDVQYKVTNRSGKTVVKKVKIHILEYLTDNQADKDNKYRYVQKDCSTKNDYCMEYFKEDSKWITNEELNNQIIDSLSKDKSEEAIKKYHFDKDDVQKAKQ